MSATAALDQPHPNPLRREGLLGRVAPFAGVTLLVAPLTLLSPVHVDGHLILPALLLTVVIITSPWYVPWERLPFGAQAIPPISYYVVIALLREAEGGSTSGFAPLVVLPVIWLALYGTRTELCAAIIGVGATFSVPVAIVGEPHYPTSELTRGALWIAVALVIGFITQHLVSEVRQQAAAAKRQAEVLRQSEERTRRILETAHDSFISIDSGGSITHWNRQAEEMFGWSRAEAIGRRLADTIIPPELREAHTRGLERFLKTGNAVVLNQRLELTALRRNGEEFPVELTISPLEMGDEYVFNAFLRDVTDRRRSERALRESQHKLQSILDNNTAVIYAKDREYRYLLVNQEFERLFRLTSEELVGKTDDYFLPPEVVEHLRVNDRKVLERGETLREEEVVPRDGELKTYVSSKFPLLDADGVPYAVCGISTDITDRKRTEEYFRAQHEVTRVLAQVGSLTELMPAVLESLGSQLGWELGFYWSLDDRASVLRCEESWYSPGLAHGEFDELVRRLAFDRGSGLPGHVWKTGKPVVIANILEDPSVQRARAALRMGLRSAIALPIQSGARFLGVLEFFTRDSKAPDQELIDMLGSLGAQLAQFIERKQAEQEADRLKEEFFSLVSHEFRTPLTSIIGFVDLLQDSHDGEISLEERARFLEVIKRNSERLKRLVNDLLFISKIQAGQFSLTPRRIDMSAVASQCLEAARPTAEENGINLTLAAGDVPPVFGDPDRLAQLLDNLVTNAVKYTPEGERVEVRLSTEDDHLVVEVTNSGVHIPPGEVDHIFERFYRASTAARDESQGVGLGLTIAQAIATAHGGEISVTSDAEQGTAFRVLLPLQQEVLDQSSEEESKEAAV